jgi:hypothetical protein
MAAVVVTANAPAISVASSLFMDFLSFEWVFGSNVYFVAAFTLTPAVCVADFFAFFLCLAVDFRAASALRGAADSIVSPGSVVAACALDGAADAGALVTPCAEADNATKPATRANSHRFIQEPSRNVGENGANSRVAPLTPRMATALTPGAGRLIQINFGASKV